MKKLFFLFVALLTAASCSLRFDNIYEDESLFPTLDVHIGTIKDITSSSAVIPVIIETEKTVLTRYVNISEESQSENYWSIVSYEDSNEFEVLADQLNSKTTYYVRAVFVTLDGVSHFGLEKHFKTH